MIAKVAPTNKGQKVASQSDKQPPTGFNSNALTLTFQGVNFRLMPSPATANSCDNNEASVNSSAFVSFANGPFTTINLQSFTGTLMIYSETENVPDSGAGMDLAHITPAVSGRNEGRADKNSTASARRVEDEPPTPESYSNHTKISALEQGQQQLAFQRVVAKKRNKSESDRKSKTKKQKHQSSQNKIPTLGQMSQDAAFSPKRSSGDSSSSANLSSIERLVHQEEMKGTQTDMETDEATQIFEDSTYEENRHTHDKKDGNDDHSLSENHNAIMEYEDDEVEAGNPYASTSLDKGNGQNLPLDKNLPCDRWGHTMTLIDEDRLLVYGGQTFDKKENKLRTLADLHVYDMTKHVWSKPVNCEGVPRCWHSATFLPDRQLLISFGGEAYNPKTKKTTTTDQVMVLDTEIMLWYPPSVSGAIPTGRSGHTASMLQNDLLVFGGVKNNKWQKSLAVLDTMLWKWSVPKVSGDAPRARSYHSATPIPSSNLLVIFGGNNETECFNSVHVLDASSEKWSWFHPTITGTAPCPRTGHSAVLLEDGKTILIYGGWDPNVDEDDIPANDEDMFFGDSFLLDTERWAWKPGPKPKFGSHQLGIDNGGIKRAGAPAILAPGEDVSQMLLFGGRIPNDRLSNDFQSITVPHRMMGM